MRDVVASIEGEYGRYKRMAEDALAQLSDEELFASSGPVDNAPATIAQHVGGNLRSRFTDFLTSDGEKPWRDREAEFTARAATRNELFSLWETGWAALFGALADLDDARLHQKVVIRGQSLSVAEALHRSLAHTASHVGQIVFVAKHVRGGAWKYLTIPPGGSAAYNADPRFEKPRTRTAG